MDSVGDHQGGAVAAPRSFAIVGVGALGGFYGARLQRAGHEVHYLLRSDYDHVREKGLVVESVDGDFSLPRVHAHCSADTVPPVEVVVVALKATANAVLAEVLPRLVRPGTTVLLMQNGLGVEEEIARISPEADVVGGLCFLCSNRVGPGHIQHLDYGAVTLGQYRPGDAAAGVTPAVVALSEDFAPTGIEVVLDPDLHAARWRKLVWNIPFNGLSVVLDAGTDELIADGATRSLLVALMQEVREGAASCDRTIEDSFLDRMISDTEAMVPYRTSMKLDYDLGRPLELEAIYGNPLRAARQRGSDLRRIDTLYRQLRFLDERNRQ